MMAATTNLPGDTPESAKEALDLLEPFFKAWRDSDPEGMVARIADGKVDYIDYCRFEFCFSYFPGKNLPEYGPHTTSQAGS